MSREGSVLKLNSQKEGEMIKNKNTEEVKKILELHQLWLANKEGGERADFTCKDLQNIVLKNSILRYVIFIRTNLSGSDLSGSDLGNVELEGADLTNTNLSNTDLRFVDLRLVNLSHTIIDGACMDGANFTAFTVKDVVDEFLEI